MNTSIVDLLEAYPLPEQEQTPNYQIYCDMDGVLTDFENRFLNVYFQSRFRKVDF